MKSRLTRLSVLNQIIVISMLAVLIPAFVPGTAAAQTDTKPLVLEIKSVPKIPDVKTIQYLASNNSDDQQQVDPVTINAPILQDYLTQKGSPLAPYAEDILQNENWKLVLAISNGESTLCKHQLYNNCWGVGGAWNLKRYKSFSEGFADVDQLLSNRYADLGLTNPQKIVKRYVGSYSPTWVAAVNKTLSDLDQLPLAN